MITLSEKIFVISFIIISVLAFFKTVIAIMKEKNADIFDFILAAFASIAVGALGAFIMFLFSGFLMIIMNIYG